jgi:spermidine synthase
MSIAELLIDSNNSLILGNGAGTLQSILKTEYNKTSFGVEINPTMTRIGKELGQITGESIIDIDARVFLNRNEEVFDIVYIDIYDNNPTIPCHTCSKEFFDLVGKASHNGTIIVTNLFNYPNSSKAIDKILRTIYLTFPYLYSVDNVVFASKEEIALPNEEEISFENKIFEEKVHNSFDKFQRLIVDPNLPYYTDNNCNLEIEYYSLK